MLRKLLMYTLFILALRVWSTAQVTTTCGNAPCPAITASGGTVVITNVFGGLSGGFEELITGAPATVSVTIQGCMRGGTCDSAADTYTGTSNTIRGVTFSKPYGSFLVTASWTGGTAPTITVNPVVTIAGGGGGGGGGNVTIVNPLDGGGNVKVNCAVGCAGGASTPADTFANPTTAGLSMSFPMVWNGATWDRLYGDKTNGLFANIHQFPAMVAESTTSWTSATGSNTALTVQLAGASSVEVTLAQTTTITGGVVTFEASDTSGFTNAYPIVCTQANSFTNGSTYTLTASTNQAYDCDVSSFVAFRVRLSTVITGTATVGVGIQPSYMPAVPDVAVGGTVTTAPPANASTNLTQVNSVALGSPSNYGTSPGAVSVPGVNAFVTNTVTDNVAQFGGNNVVTGTGASGVGIPRVTISNDSTVAPTLSAGAVISGQQAVTASAVALATTTLTRPPCIQALTTNTLTVYLGPSGVTTGTGFPLAPGAALCNLPVANLNQIFVIAASTGNSVSWMAQ